MVVASIWGGRWLGDEPELPKPLLYDFFFLLARGPVLSVTLPEVSRSGSIGSTPRGSPPYACPCSWARFPRPAVRQARESRWETSFSHRTGWGKPRRPRRPCRRR